MMGMEGFNDDPIDFGQQGFTAEMQGHTEAIDPLLKAELEGLFPAVDILAASGIVAERAWRGYVRPADGDYQQTSFELRRVVCRGENGFSQDNPHDHREIPDELDMGPGPFGDPPGHTIEINVDGTFYRYTVNTYGFHRLSDVYSDSSVTLQADASEEEIKRTREEYYGRLSTRVDAQDLLAREQLLRPSQVEASTLIEAIALWEAYPLDAEDVSAKFAALIAESVSSPAATAADAQAFRRIIDEALSAQEVYIYKQRKYSLPDGQDVFLYASQLRQPDGTVDFQEYNIAIREPLATGGYNRARLEYLPDQNIANIRYSIEALDEQGYVDRLRDLELPATSDTVRQFKDGLDALSASM